MIYQIQSVLESMDLVWLRNRAGRTAGGLCVWSQPVSNSESRGGECYPSGCCTRLRCCVFIQWLGDNAQIEEPSPASSPIRPGTQFLAQLLRFGTLTLASTPH